MTMQQMVDILENRGFKVTKKYMSINEGYEFTISKNGTKVGAFFPYPSNVSNSKKDELQRGFIEDITKEFNQESKKSMKNIAFDISRDGPVGKLVIKDNVYDVCVKEVNSDRTLYNEKTYINAEVVGTDKDFVRREVQQVLAIGKNLCQGYKDGIERIAATPYNPYYRKDAINKGELQIKNVIFNDPATIVFWSDGSKTVVKAENEMYDPEKGLAMAIAKRAMGNQGNYFETFKKYVDPYKKKVKEERATKIAEVNAALDRPYYIWCEVFNTAYESAGSGKHWQAYKRRGDAVRVAKKRYGDETKFRWMVSQENPWANGEWAKKFGKDS